MHNNHSIKNSIEFINKIQNINIKKSYKIASLDIVNLYTNIPVTETICLVKENLMNSHNLNSQQINEIIKLLTTVLPQNYFTYNGKFYTQNKGLAMGSPLSGFLADIYLHNYEEKYLFSNNNIFTKNIISYSRYVDDTFIIYNGTNRQLDNLKAYLNNINNNIQFALEMKIV